MKFLEEF